MKRVVLALAFVGLASGQIPETERTNGFFNCRFWNNRSNDVRLGLIMGYADIWDIEKSGLVPLKMGKATFGEMRSGVTALCSRPENGILAVTDALTIFSFKFAGASESAVEELTAYSRCFRSLPESEQKNALAKCAK